MFKNMEEFQNLISKLILRCLFVIYIIPTIAYTFEFIEGRRTFGYLLTFLTVLWSTYIVPRICITFEKLSKFTSYSIVVGFIVLYSFCMTTTLVSDTWIYAFPFACVSVYLFSDIFLVIVEYISFIVINIISVVLSESYNKVILEQRFVCLLLVFGAMLCICYLLRRYNTVVVQIYKESAIDPITGLHSQEYVNFKIDPMIEKNKNLEYTLIMINMDKFYKVNDQYGHAYGDKVLSTIGKCIIEEFEPIKANVYCSRIYDDKFIVLVSNRVYEEVSEFYIALKDRINNTIIKHGSSELVISTTISITDTRFCEHTYNALYKRVRYLQDVARSEGLDKLIEDKIEITI